MWRAHAVLHIVITPWPRFPPLFRTPAPAWGDEHEAFKKLAETVGQADTPLVVAGVPISNSESYPANQKLAVRCLLQQRASVARAQRARCWERPCHTHTPTRLAAPGAVLPPPPPALLLQLLQARYGLLGLKDEGFPKIKLFKKGADTAKPLVYSGPAKDSKALLDWTVGQTGVFVGVKVRAYGGGGGVSPAGPRFPRPPPPPPPPATPRPHPCRAK
jgi:hypothetical protein